MTSIALKLSGITKRYPGVVALGDVSFEARPGEIHALVGENGAGKSTLIGVAAGSVDADQGRIEIDGVVLDHADPMLAQQLGIAVVYQHPAVLPDLTVAENLVLGARASEAPKARETRAWVAERLARVGSTISPEARVGQLSPAGRHFVELARAVALKPKVLILDEPTEPFSAGEIAVMFTLIEGLRDEGCCIVYISHRLPDVRRISERLTVLRDGQIRGTFYTADVSEEQLVELIVGGKLEAQFPEKMKPDATGESLSVKLANHRLIDVEFQVAGGEIFGLAGIEGNGQRDVVRALAGVDSSTGSVTKGGRPLRISSTAAALRSGISHIPADRHTEGLFGSMSIRENASVHGLRGVSRGGLLGRKAERDFTGRLADEFEVKAPTLETPVSSLSGGNQQKVLVARSVSSKPQVLLADEPTAGVDVGTRAQIYSALRDAADDGSSVLVTSSDAAELAELCDRVAVFSSGQIVRVLAGDELTEDRIVGTALAASPERKEHRELVDQGRLRRFMSGDYLPTVILAIFAAALIIATSSHSEFFLNQRNLTPLLAQIAILGLASIAQASVLMVGGVDLSVGPLMGLVTVVASFVLPAAASPVQLVLGIVVLVVLGIVVGLVNGGLIRYAAITPIVATLITYIGLQGVSLVLRPSAAGTFSTSLTNLLNQGIGILPGIFIVAAVVAIASEYALRRTRWGMKLRATGSDEVASLRLAGSATFSQLSAYVLCSLVAVAAGLLLVAQNGVGDPTSGTSYTLTSITAVVLGGASLAGGRGSYLGAFVGAGLLALVINSTTFFDLSLTWQIAAPGILILASAALYSRARTHQEAP
jgi:ribose transport system ATP-binding protein